MLASTPSAPPAPALARIGVDARGGLAAFAVLPLLLGVLPWVASLLTLGPDNGGVRSVVALWELALVGAWALRSRGTAVPFAVGRPVAVLLVWWGAAMVAATVLAGHVAPAAMRTAEWGAHGLFVWMLGSVALQDPRVPATLARAVAVGFAATVGLIGLYALRLADPYGYPWVTGVPFLGNIRYLSLYALAGAVFAATALLDPASRPASRAWAWAGLALGWGAAFWSGGRGAAGALLVAGVVLCVLAPGRRVWFAGLFAAALAAGAVLALCLPVADPGVGLWRLLGHATSATGEGGFTSGRTELWGTALTAWRADPWFGAGPDAGVYVLARHGNVQPHNLVVQALLEWGVVGAVPALLLLGALLARAVRAAWREPAGPRRALRAVAAAYLVGAAAGGLMDGLFYDARSLLLVAFAAAVALLPSRGGAPVRPFHPAARWSLAGAAALGIVLSTAHLLSARAVWAPGVPEPGSARARLVRALPTSSRLNEVAPWVRAWAPGHPAAALDLARWGARHAALPVPFYQLEGDLLLQRGDSARALDAYRRAGRLQNGAADRPATPAPAR